MIKNNDLRDLREKLRLTQLEFADALGVTRTYIGLLERGDRPIVKKFEKKLLQVFGEKITNGKKSDNPSSEPPTPPSSSGKCADCALHLQTIATLTQTNATLTQLVSDLQQQLSAKQRPAATVPDDKPSKPSKPSPSEHDTHVPTPPDLPRSAHLATIPRG